MHILLVITVWLIGWYSIKISKKCQWGEPAWLAALAHFTAWLSRSAHALFPHKICNVFLWEGGLGRFQRSWLLELRFHPAGQPAFKRKPCSAIFIDTISSQSCYMPTKIELFMSVTLVCWFSWKKKKLNPDSCKYECVHAFSVYCTSLLRALSHTSSCVIRYGRPQKNGGGSLKL